MFCRISDHLLLCIQIIKSDFQRRNSLILLLELVQFISVINSRIRMGPSIKQGYRCQPSVLCGFTCGRKDYQIPNHIVMILSSDCVFLILCIYSRSVELAAIFSHILKDISPLKSCDCPSQSGFAIDLNRYCLHNSCKAQFSFQPKRWPTARWEFPPQHLRCCMLESKKTSSWISELLSSTSTAALLTLGQCLLNNLALFISTSHACCYNYCGTVEPRCNGPATYGIPLITDAN